MIDSPKHFIMAHYWIVYMTYRWNELIWLSHIQKWRSFWPWCQNQCQKNRAIYWFVPQFKVEFRVSNPLLGHDNPRIWKVGKLVNLRLGQMSRKTDRFSNFSLEFNLIKIIQSRVSDCLNWLQVKLDGWSITSSRLIVVLSTSTFNNQHVIIWQSSLWNWCSTPSLIFCRTFGEIFFDDIFEYFINKF